MDFHRLGIDVGLERAVVIRQRRQGIFRHGVVLKNVVFVDGPNAEHRQSQSTRRQCKAHAMPKEGIIQSPDGSPGSQIELPSARDPYVAWASRDRGRGSLKELANRVP